MQQHDLSHIEQTAAHAFTLLLESAIHTMALDKAPANPWLYARPDFRASLYHLANGPFFIEIWSGTSFMEDLKDLKDFLNEDKDRDEHDVWADPNARQRAILIPTLLLEIKNHWLELFPSQALPE